jgi:hypothetical protein
VPVLRQIWIVNNNIKFLTVLNNKIMKKINEFLAYSFLAGAIGSIIAACLVVILAAQ